MRTKNRRAEMGTWFLLVVLLIPSTASLETKCEPLTDTYVVVQTGIVPGILSDKTVVEVSCSRSLPTVQAMCRNGHWYPQKPTCEERCNITITAIENGLFRNRGNVIVAGEKIESGSNITLVCFDGYELFNESISKYLESEKTDILCYQGSFTAAFPKCKPKRCQVDRSLFLLPEVYYVEHGQNLTFHCADKMELQPDGNNQKLKESSMFCSKGIWTPKTPTCTKSMCTVDPVDVVFVLDSSATMLSAGFESEKVFVKQFTDLVEIGEKQFHIGVVQFDHEGYIEFNLTAYFDKTSIKNAVQKIDYLSRGTDIAAGLSKANDVLNQTRRSIAVMYVVVLTDETLSSNKDKAFSDADKLKSNPALRILVIGIGVDANSTEELKKIASSPSYFLYVNKTAELAAVLTSTVNITCQDIKDCASSPCQNGGICETTQSGYSCKCPYGYIGVRCQDYDECIRNLCFNNGHVTKAETYIIVCVYRDTQDQDAKLTTMTVRVTHVNTTLLALIA